MRVMSNYETHVQQRTHATGKGNGFADMLTSMSAQRRNKPETEENTEEKNVCRYNEMDIAFLHLRTANPHRRHGTEIKIGQLTLAKEPCTAELVESEPFVAEPTYPSSIYDLSHDELKAAIYYAEEACRNLDKEGMSKGEIYNQIESIFQDFLGKDFKEANLLYAGMMSVGQGSIERDRSLAFQHFQLQLSRAGVLVDPATIREAKGYSDMSESEIRTAVRGQYPDVMTLKDCILMATELWELGLEEINYGTAVKMNLSHTVIDPAHFTPAVQALYEALLDTPADFAAMKASYAASEANEHILYPANDMDNMLATLLSWFGGSELANSELLDQLRSMLDEMEKSGEFVFDQFGYLQHP